MRTRWNSRMPWQGYVSLRQVILTGVLPALLAARSAAAQTPTPPAASDVPPTSTRSAEAPRHFEAGYELSQRGDYAAAAREFRLAYELSPNDAVLFNLGHAYAASGQPIAAYDAYEEYLRRSAGRINAERERLVRRYMEIAEGRIGRLWMDIDPAGASIEVDGSLIGTAPMSSAVRLEVGPHAIVVRHPDHQTEIANVGIQAREESRVSILLKPPLVAVEPGYLQLQCKLPDVELWVGQTLAGRTPLDGPIAVSPGQHAVRLERLGYLPQSATVNVQPGAAHLMPCEGRVDPAVPVGTADLFVADGLGQMHGLQVYVDGRQLLGRAIALPSGRHQVEIRVPRFEAWTGIVDLTAGAPRQLSPTLIATEEYRRESIIARERQLFWSWIALGSGVVLGGTALTLASINSGKQERWKAERARLGGELEASEQTVSRLRANYEEALTIQQLQHATVASGVVAGAALGVGALLWLTAEELPVQPHLALEEGGGGLLYSGRF